MWEEGKADSTQGNTCSLPEASGRRERSPRLGRAQMAKAISERHEIAVDTDDSVFVLSADWRDGRLVIQQRAKRGGRAGRELCSLSLANPLKRLLSSTHLPAGSPDRKAVSQQRARRSPLSADGPRFAGQGEEREEWWRGSAEKTRRHLSPGRLRKKRTFAIASRGVSRSRRSPAPSTALPKPFRCGWSALASSRARPSVRRRFSSIRYQARAWPADQRRV